MRVRRGEDKGGEGRGREGREREVARGEDIEKWTKLNGRDQQRMK